MQYMITQHKNNSIYIYQKHQSSHNSSKDANFNRPTNPKFQDFQNSNKQSVKFAKNKRNRYSKGKKNRTYFAWVINSRASTYNENH